MALAERRQSAAVAPIGDAAANPQN
jgi:hypothetical protein